MQRYDRVERNVLEKEEERTGGIHKSVADMEGQMLVCMQYARSFSRSPASSICR